MKAVKVGALIPGVAVAAAVLYLVLSFATQAGAIALATLRSAERTALHNEDIAANLAAAKPGDRLVSIDANRQSVLEEATLTLQALRRAIAETTATARAARIALVETAAAATAARVAIEGAKAPDVEPLLRQTNALLAETTRLVQDTHAGPQALAPSRSSGRWNSSADSSGPSSGCSRARPSREPRRADRTRYALNRAARRDHERRSAEPRSRSHRSTGQHDDRRRQEGRFAHRFKLPRLFPLTD